MTHSSTGKSPIQDPDQSLYSSFLLRCQRNPAGEMRVRLVDVRTGQVYTAVGLDVVPELIRRLFPQVDFPLDDEVDCSG